MGEFAAKAAIASRRRSILRRSGLATGTAILLALALAPGALAATVLVRAGDELETDEGQQVLEVRSGALERNDLTIRRVGQAATVRDSGAALAAGAGCVQIDANTAYCQPESWRVDPNHAGKVLVQAGALDDRVIVTGLLQSLLEGAQGADTLISGQAQGVLFGGRGDDRLVGGAQDDRLQGGGGRDRLAGGDGDDTLEDGDNELRSLDADALRGGRGTDRVTYAGRVYAVSVDLRHSRGQGSSREGDSITGVEHVVGGLGNDKLVGDDRANTLDGSHGSDRISAGGGNDRVIAEDRDRLRCGGRTDTVSVAGAIGPVLARDCELVLDLLEVMSVSARAVRISGKRVAFRVSCRFRGVRCQLRMTLTTRTASRQLLARGSRRIRGGRRGLVWLRLTRAGRRALSNDHAPVLVHLKNIRCEGCAPRSWSPA